MKYCEKAIILAGGRGTRIQKAEPLLPKALIKVTDRPILHYIIIELMDNGVRDFYFCLGYMASQIVDYVKSNFPSLNCVFFIENTPLGTGGTLLNAINSCEVGNYLVVNGDTFLSYDIRAFAEFHSKNQSSFSIVSVFKETPDRYGVMRFKGSCILEFCEKQQKESGWINAGHYLIYSQEFKRMVNSFGYRQTHSFSLEVFLEKLVDRHVLFGFKVESDFIDIGIPEDLNIARKKFRWVD